MAKKKNLASLMSGIMGEPQSTEIERVSIDTEVNAVPVSDVEETEMPGQSVMLEVPAVAVSEDETVSDKSVDIPETEDDNAEEKNDAERRSIRRRMVGRPRKGEERVKSDEIRATFIVDPEVIRKVKYISLVEGSLLKEVIDDALVDYIAAWEKTNGKIPLPKKR